MPASKCRYVRAYYSPKKLCTSPAVKIQAAARRMSAKKKAAAKRASKPAGVRTLRTSGRSKKANPKYK